MADDKKGQPFPPEFPKDQLFVAVSDNDGPAAGFDGGPEKGGSGAWARGDVRQWTASGAVPLALRDPNDGTIARGYLEPVEQTGEKNGRLVATKSTKFFAVYVPKKGDEPATWRAAKPTPKAMTRATRGASSMVKAFQSIAQQTQQDRLAGSGVNVG